MITRIGIENFKSLQKAELRLGHLNLFVGTNASGKSNVFDALRVLQGIGYGLTVDEIFNGKPKSASSEVWQPIRGGSAKAVFLGPKDPACPSLEEAVRLSVEVVPSAATGATVTYEIGLSPRSGSVSSEKLVVDGDKVYDSEGLGTLPNSPVFTVRYYHGRKGTQPHLDFDKSRPVLQQLSQNKKCAPEHAAAIAALIRGISNIQRIDPSPVFLRDYSQAQTVKRMGERGENFAALVSTIIADEQTRSAYLTWLQQLTPTEVQDVTILRGAVGEPLFALRERGMDYPAQTLSDGTLRFSAIAAAFFQPDMPNILTIEEIENGIHPSRVRLLVELLKNRAKKDLQVMATTHSPIVLAWLNAEDYKTTFFCKRDEPSGASLVAPLTEVPNFLEIVRKQPISDLFAEGWLEGAL